MPGLNRTGPLGAGPMTGGRRGLCNSATATAARAYTDAYGYGGGLGLRRGFRGGSGRGAGMGRGYGRGYGRYSPAMGPAFSSASEEKEILRAEADCLKNELAAINTRIDELERKSGKDS